MNSFRQVCDKPCANSIIQTEWSPLHDLVAVVTGNGDVRLHRMHWQKVWVITPKESPATCCSWKNNGKLLAVGHENGNVSIIEIDKAVDIHTLKHSGKITSLKWSRGGGSVAGTGANKKNAQKSDKFLPEIRKDELSNYLCQGDSMISEDQLCYLTVGTDDGQVFLYLDGIFLVLEIPIEKYPLKFQQHSILTTHLCLDTGTLTVVSKSSTAPDSGQCYYLHRFTSKQLCSSSRELHLLSQTYTKMYFLVQRCQKVLKQMADSSEDISLKINSKLEKLEKLVAATESSVAAEFTIAYATGETSPELETFLTQNLTSKGLKQIEQNVQLAYASMHSDITEELEVLIQCTMFHLLQLYGMSKWTEKYESLGLSEDSVIGCFEKLGRFAMRILRLLDVICSDMENFSIFFTWLTCLCFQVSAEAQATFPQLSFNDYDIMVEFLENRLQKRPHGSYNLERISQFFKDDFTEASSIVTEEPQNAWFDFVGRTEFLNNSPLIVKPDNTSTLHSQFEDYLRHFDELFKVTKASMTDSVTLSKSMNLFSVDDNHEADCAPVVSFLRRDKSLLMSLLACSCDSDRMFLVNLTSPGQNVELAGLSIEPSCSMDESVNSATADQQPQYTMKHVTFYDEDFVTFLYDSGLPDNDQVSSLLAQLPVDETMDKLSFLKCTSSSHEGLLDQQLDIEWHNILDRFAEQRTLENFRGNAVSVNAKRHVSCVVSGSGRRVRVFEMESADEDPDESRMDLDSTKMSMSGMLDASELQEVIEK